MSTSYRAAVRTGLPHATIVVDHFQVVQLANKMLSTVRRRATPPHAADEDGPPTPGGGPDTDCCATART